MTKSREQKRIERKQLKAKTRAQQYAAANLRKSQKGVGPKRTPNRKENGYKHDILNAKRRLKRNEALVRGEQHSGNFGLKEQVKQGHITACEALEGGHIPVGSKTGKWLTRKKNLVGCK